MPTKYKDWSAICYDEEFKKSLPETEYYAYIYHDKDEKEPHYHVIVCYKYPRSITGVRKKLKGNSDQNVLLQPCVSLKGAYEYLLHENEDNKYKYDPSERITNEEEHFLYDVATSTAMQIINDILQKKSCRQLIAEYGREIIINYDRYRAMADRILQEDRAEEERQRIIEADQQRKKELEQQATIRWNRKQYSGTVKEIANEAQLKIEDVLWIIQKDKEKGEKNNGT